MPATWVKPKLVCEIKFQEWTQENIMRVPIFMGLRPSKKRKDYGNKIFKEGVRSRHSAVG